MSHQLIKQQRWSIFQFYIPLKTLAHPDTKKCLFVLCYFSKRSVLSAALLPEARGCGWRWESSVEWCSYVPPNFTYAAWDHITSEVNVMISSNLGPILNIWQISCGFFDTATQMYCPATLAHPVLCFAWEKKPTKYFRKKKSYQQLPVDRSTA